MHSRTQLIIFKQHFSFQELSECYLVLFPHTLLMLSASPRMSGFIYQVHQLPLCFIYIFLHKQCWIILPVDCATILFFLFNKEILHCSEFTSAEFSLVFTNVFPQGRMPLSGMLISRIEDGENLRNAFEITGALFIQATFLFICSVPLLKST